MCLVAQLLFRIFLFGATKKSLQGRTRFNELAFSCTLKFHCGVCLLFQRSYSKLKIVISEILGNFQSPVLLF